MSRWPAHYVIGLTGNIGTGKSVVRKMLEHLGALGIDADSLSHAVMTKGAPAYEPVARTFGEWILGEDGQIHRATLAGIVFSDPRALARLEAIVHPAVGQAIDILTSRAMQPVIVIEAIKLLESGLADEVNAIWVVNAPPEVQLARLTQKRKMTEAQARQRIEAQSAQSEKLARAVVVVENGGTFDDTWAQVQAAWAKIDVIARAVTPPPVPVVSPEAATVPRAEAVAVAMVAGPIAVRRGKPGDAAQIAEFINLASANARSLTRVDVMETFGEKAYLLAETNGSVAGIAGWQVENLVTRVDDLYFAPGAPSDRILPPLIEAVEARSRELQSEAALIFVAENTADEAGRLLAASGYAPQTAEKIGVVAWREAVKESQPPGTRLLFKRLREDRVLRPV